MSVHWILKVWFLLSTNTNFVKIGGTKKVHGPNPRGTSRTQRPSSNFFYIDLKIWLKFWFKKKLNILQNLLNPSIWYNFLLYKVLLTVNEGDLGQISALTLDCGAVEYYIRLPLVVGSFLILIWTLFTLLFVQKPQFFGFQILRVIWDNGVFGRIMRLWWQIFDLLYLIVLFNHHISIWNHLQT
jgi:hypothetical protein